MTYLNGEITLVKGQHRLFETMHTIVLVNACIIRSMLASGIPRNDWIIGKPSWLESQFTDVISAQFPLAVRLPNQGPIELMMANKEATSIMIGIVPRVHLRVDGIANVRGAAGHLTCALFSQFYEIGSEWLRTNVDGDKSKWSPLWRFARIVRNALSHGGSISWLNDKAPPERWHKLTYSSADRGKKIGADMAMGDYIILMFEMSDELDRHGCPVNLFRFHVAQSDSHF